MEWRVDRESDSPEETPSFFRIEGPILDHKPFWVERRGRGRVALIWSTRLGRFFRLGEGGELIPLKRGALDLALSIRPGVLEAWNPALAQERRNEPVTLLSPITGTVLAILAEDGSQVTKGTPLMVIEAMKMENKILSPKNGLFHLGPVQGGQKVKSGDFLGKIG
jgi:hypothetical protein